MPGSVWTGYTAPQNNAIYLQALMQGLKDIGQVAQQYGQNQQANQVMANANNANPPRAALVNPENGQTVQQFEQANPKVSVSGTTPEFPTNSNGQLGGTNELEMQMALNKQNQTSASAQLESQLKRFQMANIASEMAARTRATNFNYPTKGPGGESSPTRYTPTAKQNAAANNQWGVNSSLLSPNGTIPESVARDFQKLNEDNAEFKARYGVGMEEFTKHDSGWTQNPDGTWQNNSFAGKHGPLQMSGEELTNARVNTQRAMSAYKTYKAIGWGPAMDKLLEIQGAQRNAAAFTQPDISPGQGNVAGQTGKQGVPQAQNPSSFIRSQVPLTGGGTQNQTTIGQPPPQKTIPTPFNLEPGSSPYTQVNPYTQPGYTP